MEIETHKIEKSERLEQEKKIRKALLNGDIIIDKNGHRIDRYYYSPEDSKFNPECIIETTFIDECGLSRKYITKNLVDNVAYRLSTRLKGI